MSVEGNDAFLYGAGNEKIGSIVKPHASVKEKKAAGTKLKAKFLSGLPKLDRLITKVTETVEARGMRGTATVKGVDGRRIRIRAAYAALNSLLQSCGAIVCKLWLICVMREVKARGLDVTPCGNIHDEIQAKVALKDVDEYCQICEEAMEAVGRYMGFRCPLAAEAKVGPSWAFTH